MFEKKNPIKKKKPHPLIDLRKNMPKKQVIFFRPKIAKNPMIENFRDKIS